MWHKFPFTSSFHNLLKEIDYDLSEQERAKGCVHCGGRLHQANYPRSPYGVPRQHREYYEERYSHCCSQCRKRRTSQSLRYFGRRWFPAPLFILISKLMRSASDKFCAQLQRLFGIAVSKRTCERWKWWWRDCFTATNFWKGSAGIIPIEHLNGPFPSRLFSLYTQTSWDVCPGGEVQVQGWRLVLVLRFLAPLTAGVLRAV